MKPKEKPHYVNNAQFSTSVVDYVQTVRKAKKANKKIPIVPDYIAECFSKIAEGLSINQTLYDILTVKKW